MIHDLIHYDHLVSTVEDQRRTLHEHRAPGRRVPRRPGRVRRAAAGSLVRAAERLAKEPVSGIPHRT